MGRAVITLLLCFLTFAVFATKYYVSNSGNDTNDGLSEQTPWKSLEKVQSESSTFVAGDIIAFKGGDNFNGKLVFNNMNGQSGLPIIISSYGLGQATINGTSYISGLSNEGGGIWSVNTTEPIYQVFDGDTHLKNRSIPEIKNKYDTYNNFYQVSSVSSSTVFKAEELIGHNDIVGSSVHIRTVTWIYETRKVTAFNSATGEITISSAPVNSISSDEDIFFLNNHKNFLSQEGDWSYDSSNNKLYLFSNSTPTNIFVTNKSDTGILLKNCSYINFDNISILGYEQNGLYISFSDNILVNNVNTKFNYNVGIKTVANRSNITIINSKDTGSNAAGYNLGDRVSSVENCTVHESGIINNVNWNNVNSLKMQSYGIYAEKSAKIRNNIIYDIGKSGIYFNGASLIEKNYIYDFGLYLDDSGAIYSWNENILEEGYNGAIVRSNIVESSENFDTKWKVHGVYMDGRGRGVTIENNTIMNCNQGIRMRAIRDSKIIYNKIYNSKNGSIEITHTEKDRPNDTPKNNIIEYNEILNTNLYHCAIQIMNYVNDSFDVGVLNHNKYANLSNARDVTVFTSSLKRDYKLFDWKRISSQDGLTTTDDLNWNQFPVESTISQKIKNSTFESDILDWSGWQTKRTKGIDSGNYLKVNLTGTSGILKSNNFSITKGVTYLIKFDIKTNLEPSDYDLQFSLKNASTNELDYYIHPDTEWRTYEFKFTSTITETSEFLEFYILNSNNEIHIDNIYVDEVVFDTKDRTHVAYNKESRQQSVNLPSGTWQDIDGESYSGSVFLKSFDSKLLFTKENSLGSVNANAGSDQSICNGESVTLTASGGTSYKWSTGKTTKSITVNPSTTTTYSVTVSEGENFDTDDVVVTVNTVTAAAGGNQTITEGESTTLIASGGDSYLWSTGETTQSIVVSPSSTTTYAVTAKKIGCEDTDNVIVTVKAASTTTVTANAGSNRVICLGESVTLTASGGSTYSWSNGAITKSISVNPATTTTYSVTVSKGSVSDTDDVVVTVHTVTAGAEGNQAITEGESTTLTASGGDSYLWSTGETTQSIVVSPNGTTTYTVTATKEECEDTASVQIKVNPNIVTNPPPASANAGDNVSICLGESVTLSATGGDSYVWSSGDTNKTIDVSPMRTTTYTLNATRGGTTDTDTVVVTVENCNATAEEGQVEIFLVYPNPTSGNLNIQLSSLEKEDLNLVIISLNGSIVYRDEMTSNQNGITKKIDVSSFAKGIYLIHLFNESKNLIEKVLFR